MKILILECQECGKKKTIIKNNILKNSLPKLRCSLCKTYYCTQILDIKLRIGNNGKTLGISKRHENLHNLVWYSDKTKPFTVEK